jgi:ATP-dependent DNA helicase RecQ
MTEAGRKFLQQKTPIQMRKYAGKVKIKNTIKAKVALELEGDAENELFAKLKALRMEIALKQKVPPYIVFHDKTLFEMIKVKPQSLEEMGKISGVGEAKIKSYGKLFLEILV